MAESKRIYGKIERKYTQNSVKERIEALFLDNIGKVVTRSKLLK
jgi:hypothetical protein